MAIPRSANPGRIAQNIDVFDFALSADDLAELDAPLQTYADEVAQVVAYCALDAPASMTGATCAGRSAPWAWGTCWLSAPITP